ncbi:MAG: integration host factor subunit alpha [Deltaproteobacteria bacterium]|jgi:integration host factor subunit alpha|nr:integration host factor subunit alpha [Deltaproteobacteria bacterium]
MTVTKERIVSRISSEASVPGLDARRHVETIIEIIKNNLAANRPVLISGFGKFMLRKKKSRMGRNPQTGFPMMLKARQVVTFKVSGVLRKKISTPPPTIKPL